MKYLRRFFTSSRKNNVYDFSEAMDVFQEFLDEFGFEKIESTQSIFRNYRSTDVRIKIQDPDAGVPYLMIIALIQTTDSSPDKFNECKSFLDTVIVPRWRKMGLFVKIREDSAEETAISATDGALWISISSKKMRGYI